LFGSNFIEEMSKDIPFESIPSSLGGGLPMDNWGFEFDTSSEGKFIAYNVK
jgi:hypothetical protein